MRLCYAGVLFCASLAAAAPPEPAPAPAPDSVIQLPDAPVPVPPAPPPGARVALAGEKVYDFRTTAPCVVRAYPAALVSITSESVGAGETLRIRDAFFDGTKTRSYKGPVSVYFVKAAGTGPVELVIVPVGFKAEAEIKTVGLDVDSGQGPIPPPKPIPPDPKPPGPVTSFRVFFVYESGATLTAAQTSVLYGKAVEDYLNASCTLGKAGWRRRDKDAGSEFDPTMKALWDAIKPEFQPPKSTPPPAVAVEVNGKVEVIPLAATPAEMVAVFKKYNGGK